MDTRLQHISFSSLGTLHECPRKFQLNRLNAAKTELREEESITFNYGHIVGTGIQLVMQGFTEDQILIRLLLDWKLDLFTTNPKQHKSFWEAVYAVQKFLIIREAGFLNDYELVYWNDTPAVELSFRITFPDGFRFRGFVDVVLKHKVTGEVMVLENKTTSFTTVIEAQYKNSAQGIGYSVVLDVLFPGINSYSVLYLIYKTKDREFIPMPFTKLYLQRALWIKELLLDIETIKLYEEAQVYPMRGESCYNWYRECEYINSCTLSTNYLVSKNTGEKEEEEFAINLTIQDLIDSQIDKL